MDNDERNKQSLKRLYKKFKTNFSFFFTQNERLFPVGNSKLKISLIQWKGWRDI